MKYYPIHGPISRSDALVLDTSLTSYNIILKERGSFLKMLEIVFVSDNPCPQQGDIVNIRLSETMESLQHPDGTFRPMIVDMYFQMNYASGEWKRVKKFREKEPDTE